MRKHQVRSPEGQKEERVLILAPNRDALRYQRLLHTAGLAYATCRDVAELCREIEAGTGAVLLDQAVLDGDAAACLHDILGAQPPWSDLPMLVITQERTGERRAAWLESRDHILLLARPVRPAALVSAARMVLSFRRRQYQFRDYLRQHEQIERVLRERQERLHIVEQAGGVGVFEWDLLAARITWSEQLEAIYGIPPGSFEGTPEAWSKMLHPDDVPLARKEWEEAIRIGRRETGLEYRIRRPDGEIRWVATRGTITYDAAMQPIRLVGTSTDITERKQVEMELRESEEKFRLLAERAKVLIGIVGDRHFLYVNPALEEVTGYTREELLKVDIAELLHPDCREVVLDRIQRRLGGEPFPAAYQYKIVTKAGQTRWVETSSVQIEYQGHPAVIGTATDITERKQAEEALRYSEARFRAFFDMAVVGTIEVDPSTSRFARVNQRFCEMTGYSSDELAGMTLKDLTHPEDRQWTGELFAQVLAGKLPEYVLEKRSVRKDGQVIWVHVSVAVLRDEGGKPLRAAGIVEDITERKHMEEMLRGRTKGLKILSDTATTLLRSEHPEQVLQQIFDELAGTLGVEICVNYSVAPELGGIRLNITSGIDEATRSKLAFLKFGEGVCGTVAQTGERLVAEYVQRLTDERTELLRELGLTCYACFPIRPHARTVGTLAFGTRRRNAFTNEELDLMRAVADQVALALERQELLDESKKRAEELAAANRAKDDFLAVLSHELRTPLTPVLIEASSLQDEPMFPDVYREQMGIIRRNIELEARLIDDLLDITRIARGKLQLALKPVDLASVLRDTVQTCAPDARAKGLRLELKVQEQCCAVFGDSARLQQVFWNLIKNAIKFTPEGGRITVNCDTRPAQPRELAVVTVTDTGPGIEPELLPRLFGAFEQGSIGTTRQFGGLGLGLAICKALVEMHSGSIHAESKGRGKGATFRVELPMMPSQARVGVPADRRPPEKRYEKAAGLRILFVEDHPDTAFVVAQLLRRRGHLVRTAGSVRSALEVAEQEHFDLIISDIGLPDGSGADIMRDLKRLHPEVTGIALSGYGTDEDVEKSREAGFSEHLVKPIDFAELFQTVARVGQH